MVGELPALNMTLLREVSIERLNTAPSTLRFSQIVLDSFFQLIAGIDPSHRSSALKVGYHLSRSQGYVTSMGPAFGNPKGT